jgi:hypothetical protein
MKNKANKGKGSSSKAPRPDKSQTKMQPKHKNKAYLGSKRFPRKA